MMRRLVYSHFLPDCYTRGSQSSSRLRFCKRQLSYAIKTQLQASRTFAPWLLWAVYFQDIRETSEVGPDLAPRVSSVPVWPGQFADSSYFVSSLASPQRVQLAIPESFPWLSLTELAVTSGRAISVSALTTTTSTITVNHWSTDSTAWGQRSPPRAFLVLSCFFMTCMPCIPCQQCNDPTNHKLFLCMTTYHSVFMSISHPECSTLFVTF